jgi:hypothetical protein
VNGPDRYQVMRRSRAIHSEVTVTQGVALPIARRVKNRVSLQVFCSGVTTNTKVTVHAANPSSTFAGYVIQRTLTDAVNVQSFQYQRFEVNIWDHGDAVNHEWFLQVVGSDVAVMVIEVIDPEWRERE